MSESKDWVCIFKDRNFAHAIIVKDTLIERGVEAIIIDKMDSSYQDFGDREVFVLQEQVELAQKIIEQDVEFE
ncbi:DUF2007 domain-containing protein [Sediminitomix flava]|uniref:Putative signal transducing protein n=1 Tax=Sediminitomix flava TaxID=379075 RepID=A0A315Z5G1_SEDFL|nr:DUF2007 domain-containing protein [Sediminitomix flava]PWJ39133.1 putative signal transducing protein [Sediminitomix flava]